MALAMTAWRAHPVYGDAIEAEIENLGERIERSATLSRKYDARWLAIQLLEGDNTLLAEAPADERELLQRALSGSRERLRAVYGEDVDIAIADHRYRFVHELVHGIVSGPQETSTPSDRLDRILTHKWLGIPILLALMYLVFNLVQTVSAPYLTWIDATINGPLSGWTAALFSALQAPAWLTSLVAEGVIAGVGGVVVFLPGLLVMFFALAFLEASGYMARAAFVMDRAMNMVGLQGQSFMPMILGFGCNVPAIYATRTIENRAARVLTGLLIPFMSCSARLPVYVIFGLAFFGERASLVIWSLYVLGVAMAALVGVVLSRTVFRQASPSTFVMEMPAYRWPAPDELWRYTWRQTAAFLRKAGTFILVVSVLFWVLMHLPWGVQNARDSAFGRVSQSVAPVFEPAGFGNWEASGALLTGVLAKEAVVASLSQIYVGEDEVEAATPGSFGIDVRQIGEGFVNATMATARAVVDVLTPGISLFEEGAGEQDTALTAALRQSYSPLAGLAFVVFVLLYVPCMATVGAQIQEFGWRWAGLSALIMLVVPWLAAVAVYQCGRLLGFA